MADRRPRAGRDRRSASGRGFDHRGRSTLRTGPRPAPRPPTRPASVTPAGPATRRMTAWPTVNINAYAVATARTGVAPLEKTLQAGNIAANVYSRAGPAIAAAAPHRASPRAAKFRATLQVIKRTGAQETAKLNQNRERKCGRLLLETRHQPCASPTSKAHNATKPATAPPPAAPTIRRPRARVM